MKKVFTLCVGVLLAAMSIYAQDIIVTNDAQKIEAKILEISKTEIKYKEKDYIDGPTFVLGTNEISTIIYANGKVVLYHQEQQQLPQQLQQQEEQKQEVQQVPTYVPTVDESMAEVLLLSGKTITVQITEMKSDHIAYILEGNPYTLPASQIDKVTFLKGGQVREYKGRSVGQTGTSSQNEGGSSAILGQIPSKIIYTASEFHGDYLPKFTYKKVNVPGKKYKKRRYVGGNMVLTEKEFVKFIKLYCQEAYHYRKLGDMFLAFEIISLFIGLIPVVIFAIFAVDKYEKVLPTYNATCGGRKVTMMIDPQDYFTDEVQLSHIHFE